MSNQKQSSILNIVVLASTQTIGLAFPERIREVENSKYEQHLLKRSDCFFDGNAFVNSDQIF